VNQADAWAALGIEPTEDMRAVRVAYADRLKRIDPDSDPQAFIVLREARDLALYLVQTDAAHTPPEPIEEEVNDEVPPPAVEWETISPAEAHARELYALLHAERDPAHPHATEAEAEAMLAHWQVIAADPRLEEIGFFAQVENWAIGLIAYNTPLSDPLIVPATELFGWTASDDTVQQSREVAHITHRYGGLRYLEDVRHAHHPHNAAWQELVTPAGTGAKRGAVAPAHVMHLLETIRQVRPTLENRFDPGRVELWDRMGGSAPAEPVEYVRSEYPERSSWRFLNLLWPCWILLLWVPKACSWQATEPPARPAHEIIEPRPSPIYVPPPERAHQPSQVEPGAITVPLPPFARDTKPLTDEQLREMVRRMQEHNQPQGLDAFPIGNASR
jgi:hypothetical protein